MDSFRVRHLEWVPGWVLVLGLVVAAAIGMFGWRKWPRPAWMRRATKNFTMEWPYDVWFAGQPRLVRIRRWYTFPNGVMTTNYHLLSDRPVEFLTSGSSDLRTQLQRLGSHEYELAIPEGCHLLLVRIGNALWLLRFTSYLGQGERQDNFTMTREDIAIPNVGLTIRIDYHPVTGSTLISLVTPHGRFVRQGPKDDGLNAIATLLDPRHFSLTELLASDKERFAHTASDQREQIEFIAAELAKLYKSRRGGKFSAILGQTRAYLSGRRNVAANARALMEQGRYTLATKEAPVEDGPAQANKSATGSAK